MKRSLGFALLGVVAGLSFGLAPKLAARESRHDVRGALVPDVLVLPRPEPAWVHVPQGSFTMGSSGDEIQSAFLECRTEPLGTRCRIDTYGDEQPTRRVQLSAYWLARTEVTVAEYTRCVNARRCRPPPYFRGAQRFRRDEVPVSLVSHQDARDYCAFQDARLPTEAEFERAARGPRRRVYPWGNLYDPRVSNHGRLASDPTSDVDGFTELAPVGSFPEGRSAEGALDLAGNVSEWVSDRYALEYDAHDLVDPEGPTTSSASSLRVIRGGDYESPGPEVRGAWRAGLPPSERRPSLGFRCARAARP